MTAKSRMPPRPGWLHRLLRKGPSTGVPLMDEDELLRLRRWVELATLSPFAPQQEPRQARVGERISAIRGSGMDFDDSRPFMAGDDRRHINWRLFARTGELHLKLFREERRPRVCLLLDRRGPMRMGSGSRLKLSQALNIAVALALAARREQMSVAALSLQARSQWYKERASEAGVIDLIHLLNEPAPPVEEAEEPSLNEALGRMQGLPGPGAIVCLISDFHDLDEQAMPRLWQLVSDHDVLAFHVIDAMERSLPQGGRLRLAGEPRPLEIDCGDGVLRQAYAEEMRRHLEGIQSRLQQMGVHYHAVDSDEEFVPRLLGVNDGAGQA